MKIKKNIRSKTKNLTFIEEFPKTFGIKTCRACPVGTGCLGTMCLCGLGSHTEGLGAFGGSVLSTRKPKLGCCSLISTTVVMMFRRTQAILNQVFQFGEYIWVCLCLSYFSLLKYHFAVSIYHFRTITQCDKEYLQNK